MFYTHTINSKFTTWHEYINSLLLAMSKFKEEKKTSVEQTLQKGQNLCAHWLGLKKKFVCLG